MKQNFSNLFETSILNHWELSAFTNYQSNSITYGEIAKEIIYLHHIFEKNNIKKGDKIAIMGKSCINWGVSYLASITYGAVVVPVLSEFPPEDVHYIVSHSEAKLFICSETIFANLKTEEMPQIEAVMIMDDMSLTFKRNSFTIDIPKIENFSKQNFKLEQLDNNNLGVILYTSGTSGFSKGVMLTLNSLVANIVYAKDNMPLKAGDQIVSFLPLAHAYGCSFEFLYPFLLGCNITFFGKLPSPQLILKAFGEIKPRLILSVPLIIEKIIRNRVFPKLKEKPTNLLLKTPLLKNLVHKKIRQSIIDSLGGEMIEYVIGGAPLDHEIEIFLRKIKFPYAVGYGMTECGPLICYAGYKTGKFGSSGKPIDYNEIKTINVNNDGIGEFVIRGENVMLGYYKNEEATKTSFTDDGWMKTGDLGYLDNENYIFIKGRSKSLILGSSGKNIFPEEIESKINGISSVQESLVVERNGKLHALIRFEDGFKNQENNIKNKLKEVNERLPKHMQIAEIEFQENDFIKTPKHSIKRYKYQDTKVG